MQTPQDAGLISTGLSQLLQELRNVRQPSRMVSKEGRALFPCELLSALSLLQISAQASYQAVVETGLGLAMGLRMQVLQAAAALGVADPSGICLEPADENVLDLVGRLFDAILRDSYFYPEPRMWIGQLLVPVAKVALLDSRLFECDDHPVWRLLTLLIDACNGNNGENSVEQALLMRVCKIVDTVVREFDNDVQLFLTQEATFSVHYEQYLANTQSAKRHVTEPWITKERRQRAHQIADDALKKHLHGHVLPQAIEHFLSRIWFAHVQQVALLNDGHGPALEAVLALGDALLAQWRQASEGRTPERPWLDDERTGIFDAFSIAGMTLAEAKAGFADLQHVLAAATPQSPAIATSAGTQVVDVLLPVPDESATCGLDTATAAYFRGLSLGTWLDFIGLDGRVQSGQLSWVSPISGRLMFVNHLGRRLCVASPEELSTLMCLGRLRLHRDGDALLQCQTVSG
ncbi:DUF1631 domain-containing protein [Xylella taiwanensis]|uniref:DUF1631 domain-containing protein n=1 Tax=Xylella taiwanensis TaxID=1444770 RepID=A0ABS8TYH3_9GAMM|nr:DUF1631 family protein [Xylella taiwanensis]MCD8456443.1 DUF1631 domain-containing protein [Xylella taiwanensis]MCD8458850.1 DUF1631 domain-containing protein [Xylella taiwanensis]MCD8460987.1 DUF1631 domain-containing protein [Xylella taiwanensis]MCD8462952.1 DUF1631 domain-containing protein [Xylella taiwanensis]MCD8465493.1 DUF1631 domain-containing protein [Xylella taiwanensis]